jgi:hypothetical protein
MFLGHFAVGFAAKRIEPRMSLALLLAAPQWLDLVWPIFVLAGIERVEVEPGNTAFTPLAFTHYPWSHSFAMTLVWASVFGGIVLASGGSRRAAWVSSVLVASHWVLDVVSHRPDMPIWPGGPEIGFGLWHTVSGTIAVELSLYAVGIALYVRATQATDRVGTWALVGLIAFLFVTYLGAAFGPPPPSAKAVTVSALALWVIPVWGLWIERHRVASRGADS